MKVRKFFLFLRDDPLGWRGCHKTEEQSIHDHSALEEYLRTPRGKGNGPRQASVVAMMGRGTLAAAVAFFAAGRGASASCAFRFEGHLNISELPTWTIPASEAFSSGYQVLNDYPLVYLGEWNCCVSVSPCRGRCGGDKPLCSVDRSYHTTRPKMK